jgi:hypothetical protein
MLEAHTRAFKYLSPREIPEKEPDILASVKCRKFQAKIKDLQI